MPNLLSNLECNQLEILQGRIQNLTSAPSSPVEGQVYWNSTSHFLRGWDGSAWTNSATDSLLLGGHSSSYHLDRTNHTGTQTASSISNLAATVQAYTLDQFAAPAGDISLNSHKITNLLAGTATTDAVNKSQLDAAIQGISAKYVATAATTGALPACTYANGASGVGATLTGNSNGALAAQDGYTVSAADVLLVKNQAAPAQNGLYTVTQVGTGGTPFILTRMTDMDTATEFQALIAVEDNGSNSSATKNTLWLSTCAASITVGTTAVPFVQLNSATSYTQGNGISISGSVVSAVADTGISVTGSGIAVDTAVVVRKYATDVVTGAATSIVVTHNLGTRDVQVTLRDNTTPYAYFEVDIAATTTNTVTLTFAVAPTTSQYRCIVQG